MASTHEGTATSGTVLVGDNVGSVSTAVVIRKRDGCGRLGKGSGFFLKVGDVPVGQVQMRLDAVPDFAPALGHGHGKRVN
jgi:hypothetical protein